MTKTSISGDRAKFTADPHRGSAVLGSLSALNIFVSRRPSWSREIVESIRMGSPTCTLYVLPLVALIWALVLGHTSSVNGLAARDLTRPSQVNDLAAKVDQAQADAHTLVAQSEHESRPRSLKRSGARSKIALWKNSDCDDETSEDSDDDDDTSNDLNDDDDTDMPIVFWIQDPVRYLIVVEAEFAPSWTETLASPFPTYRQLRC
jgi:hypothetical protein